MPEDNIKTAKITYHTDERDLLKKLTEKYKCSPFTGECYTDQVAIQKIKQFYHIILTEEQMKQFNDDYIIGEEDIGGRRGKAKKNSLLMIKPTLEDNNYIFFRRK